MPTMDKSEVRPREKSRRLKSFVVISSPLLRILQTQRPRESQLIVINLSKLRPVYFSPGVDRIVAAPRHGASQSPYNPQETRPLSRSEPLTFGSGVQQSNRPSLPFINIVGPCYTVLRGVSGYSVRELSFDPSIPPSPSNWKPAY